MIESFASLQTNTVRSNVTVEINSASYGAFLVSTYVHSEDEAVDIKVAESLEVWVSSQWVFYYLNLETQQWSTTDNTIVTLSISLSTSTIVNEGDVVVNDNRQLRLATDTSGTPLYGVWQEVDGAYVVVWYNLDNSVYTGATSNLLYTQNTDNISSSVSLWYADLRTSDNQWLLLYQVISTDASGNILQVVYVQENGQVFVNTANFLLSQTYISQQTTEVYQVATVTEQMVTTDIDVWVAGREVLEMTLNIVTPRLRASIGRSTLILGNTTQVLPLGRKGYYDCILPGHKIITMPKVELANGSRLDCDLRFSIPATVVKSVVTV